MMRTEAIQIWLAMALAALGLGGGLSCSDGDGEARVDSQSHWLELCSTTSDCKADFMCLCGVCTWACDPAADGCALETEAGMAGSCVTVDTSLGLGLCDQAAPPQVGSGLCLTECSPGGPGCPEGLLCVDGTCVRDPGPGCDHTTEPPPGLCADGQSAEPVVSSDGCIEDWQCSDTENGACPTIEPPICTGAEVPVEEFDANGCTIAVVCRPAEACIPGQGYSLTSIPIGSMDAYNEAVAACEAMESTCTSAGFELSISEEFPDALGPPHINCSCVCPQPSCTPGSFEELAVFPEDPSSENMCAQLGAIACSSGSSVTFEPDPAGEA
ncbi:MAG: hypothetical protein AAFX99_02450, partial [Myxococcota bacterium]